MLYFQKFQETTSMISTGESYFKAGQYADARKKFIDVIRIMEEVLAPPVIDLCQCQQYLKHCFLYLGNTYNIQG